MAYESNMISFVGNLTDDPELRFTSSGTAVANCRVASNRKWTGADGNQQEETTFLNVTAWRDQAEHAAESLAKGDRVVVLGRIQVRSYEDRDGVQRWVTEIQADEIAPSLRWATAEVQRSSSGSPSRQPDPPPPDDDVPF